MALASVRLRFKSQRGLGLIIALLATASCTTDRTRLECKIAEDFLEWDLANSWDENLVFTMGADEHTYTQLEDFFTEKEIRAGIKSESQNRWCDLSDLIMWDQEEVVAS